MFIKRNCIPDNRSNNSVNSSSLSSIESDSNSCNYMSPLFDDKIGNNNKNNKPAKSKFCFKKNDKMNEKDLSNFKEENGNENSGIDLKENVFIDSDVEFDDKEEDNKERLKSGDIFIDEKEEEKEEVSEDNNFDSIIDYVSDDNKKDFNESVSKIMRICPGETQKKFNHKIALIIEELLTYIEKDNKENNNNNKINIQEDFNNNNNVNNNKIFFSKTIIEKISDNFEEDLIKGKEYNNTENTTIHKAEVYKEENINSKEGINDNINLFDKNNYISPRGKTKNILFKSPSKNIRDEKLGINDTSNIINSTNKSPEEKDKENNENELGVCKIKKKGLKISSFKFILPLAKGGYGSVGLYKKISTGDFYAIKSVNINSMKEKNLTRTLKKEKDILKEINSDYIVNSYFIFKDNKNYYYVMEYLPGGDLYKLLSSIILPESTIQLILAEIILGINYLHKIHIIHHDIKPENVLITKDGHFKLSDFGLSKTIKEDYNYDLCIKNFENLKFIQNNAKLLNEDNDNEMSQAMGTLNYMAPELFTDEYPEGPNVDYWSVGVVLYELYSFKVPFEAETQEETRKNIIELKINWDNLLNDDIKKQYKNIDNGIDLIKKFLVKNPVERWGDKHLTEIKKHPFFSGFNWDNIQKIKNTPVMKYLKKVVGETNKKIKEQMDNPDNAGNNDNDKNQLPFELNFETNEESEENNFTKRLDNLTKRNNELIRMKFKKKEFHFKEIKEKDSLFLELK